jgi:hypothetical protein
MYDPLIALKGKRICHITRGLFDKIFLSRSVSEEKKRR